MNAKPVFKVVSCLVALFVMGSMCGYAVSSRVTHGRPAWTQSQEWAERWLEQRMAQDFSRIEATPEQQAQLKPSYDRLLSDFNAIQRESAQKVTDAFKRHGLDIWKQLTPKQRETLRQTNQERVSRRAANSNPPAN
jgi:Spy/CpxP family protein refolding chaperone